MRCLMPGESFLKSGAAGSAVGGNAGSPAHTVTVCPRAASVSEPFICPNHIEAIPGQGHTSDGVVHFWRSRDTDHWYALHIVIFAARATTGADQGWVGPYLKVTNHDTQHEPAEGAHQ